MPGRTNAFAGLPPTPENHFKLSFYLAVLNMLQEVSRAFGSWELALRQFPFLAGYHNELAERGLASTPAKDVCEWWSDELRAWESNVEDHLPLRALCEAEGYDQAALTFLLSVGLVEEDSRFGFLFEHFQGVTGQPRPNLGLLDSWFPSANGFRSNVRRMMDIGLVQTGLTDAPRSGKTLHVPSILWEALRGERPIRIGNWGRYQPKEDLPKLKGLILPDDIARQVKALPELFDSGELRGVIVRGARHNGRRTLLAAVAAMLGRPVLEIGGLSKPDDARWSLIGPLTTLLHAMPVIVFEPGPGETVTVPELEGYRGPTGVVLGKQGGITGTLMEQALTLSLPMPDADSRRAHWRIALPLDDAAELDFIGERFRLTSGSIYHTARLAASYAAADGRKETRALDVRRATSALSRQTLETLAKRVNATGGWEHLAVTSQTLAELANLKSRCRFRERLHEWTGAAHNASRNAGVRALFSGPSGTGKTLAAQLLAAELQMDLYRLDLSSVVNKYIGETEKNLDQVFARAEEMDVIVLLDEGDSLLTQRTNVNTSNDRYANLETNYLLQRLESFEGILIVTTNAVDRIDSAFQRRMDLVIDFRQPEAVERWNIWRMHLPSAHEIDERLLTDVSGRCVLSGGQIRNAAQHASVLALEEDGVMKSVHLELAVHREYRKIGAVCPLRRTAVSAGALPVMARG